MPLRVSIVVEYAGQYPKAHAVRSVHPQPFIRTKKNGPENSTGPFNLIHHFKGLVGWSFFRRRLLAWPLLGGGGLLFREVLGVHLGLVPR